MNFTLLLRYKRRGNVASRNAHHCMSFAFWHKIDSIEALRNEWASQPRIDVQTHSTEESVFVQCFLERFWMCSIRILNFLRYLFLSFNRMTLGNFCPFAIDHRISTRMQHAYRDTTKSNSIRFRLRLHVAMPHNFSLDNFDSDRRCLLFSPIFCCIPKCLKSSFTL